ncbi:DUF5598 domain-containing protein [Candidatus Gracilibacteria bacterium]|nr:DUF5598 domain-containing protein [Candidatus Gracilibacteria bacterium]
METKYGFDLYDYKRKMNAFPTITYKEFEEITDLQVREDIAKKNKIVSTDTYNRTMTYLKGDKVRETETFTLTFRRSPNNIYNVIYGVRKIIKSILETEFTQQELDFAVDFYETQKQKGGNSYFNKKMWQEVITKHNGHLPLTINVVEDGTVLKPNEPVMTVAGPAEFAAVFEPIFLRIFFQSVVATDMHFIEQIIGEGRVVEFGKRATVNEKAHIDAMEALYVGGGLKGISNDTAALVIPQTISAGTTAHRYFACYPTEDEAFVNAIEKTEKIALLVDLVDSYKGIDKIIALKKKYRNTGKIINMRLDSGDLVDQAIYALNKQKENGLLDPKLDKIVVADISNVDKIKEIEEKVKLAGFEPKDFILYGLGGLLVARNKLRDALSAAFKLTDVNGEATGKLSNDKGKEVIPGKLNIELRDGERCIVQEDEEVNGIRLLKKVYENGEMFFEENDLDAIDKARRKVKEEFNLINLPTRNSPKTEKLIQEVRYRFLGIDKQEKAYDLPKIEDREIPNYKQLGFKIVENDNYSTKVILPNGWQMLEVGEIGGGYILDEKCRKRIIFFNHNRSREENFANILRRYEIENIKNGDDWVWVVCDKASFQNKYKDGILFQVKIGPQNQIPDAKEYYKGRQECNVWLKENFPEAWNPLAYWD